MNKASEKITNHRHKNHLILLIIRREWGNVTCTCEKWKCERRIYSLWKILSDNLGMKSESLTWLVCRNKRVVGTWSWHILGRHINFTKPKTYSALLSPKAYDSPHLWKEFMRVTKHFLLFQKLRRIYDTFLYNLMWIKCVYLSPVTFKYNDLHFENPTTAKTNIWANIFQILRTKALTSTFHKHVVQLCK